jgi:hypothetical protein
MAKCYIISCAACDRLHKVSRRDALTCSIRCRVWLKRHPDKLQFLREICRKLEVTLFLMLQAKARLALRPELEARICSGEVTLEDVQHEWACAIEELAIKQARELCDE